MKKIILIILFVFIAKANYAQDISYGLNLNASMHQHIELKTPSVNGSLSGRSSNGNFNFGGYFEYIFNDKIGLRGSLLYGKKEDNYFQLESFTIDVSTLQFNPVIKYSFGQNYDKGFYLFTGPSVTFILKTENDGDEITDFYKKVNFGVQLGFGVNFLKYLAFELKVYQGFSKFLDAVEEKNYYVDFSATVLFKIDKLISK